jgi:hypothetical protein
MEDLWVLRFIAVRSGVVCEAIFKDREDAMTSLGLVREQTGQFSAGKASEFCAITDSFGVTHAVKLSDFCVAVFSLKDLAARNQAVEQVNAKLRPYVDDPGKGFLPSRAIRQ